MMTHQPLGAMENRIYDFMDSILFGSSHQASYYQISPELSRHTAASRRLQSDQISWKVVFSEILLQIFIFGGAYVYWKFSSKNRIRRRQARDEQRIINYDIERQTRRPGKIRPDNHERLSAALQELFGNRLAGSYILSDAEIAELHALANEPKDSRTHHSLNCPINLKRTATYTTPLLPFNQNEIRKKKWYEKKVWKSFVFKTTLHTRYSIRNFLKRLRSLRCKVDAWAMRQPDKVAFTGLQAPTNGVSLAICMMLFINFLFLFLYLPTDGEFFYALAKRAAMLNAANIPVLYLLAMKTQPLQYLTGYSYEQVNIFHRRLGEQLLLFTIIHSAGHITPMFISFIADMPLDTSDTIIEILCKAFEYFSQYVSQAQLRSVFGIIALVGCVTILITSTPSFRRRRYQLFLFLHAPLQVATLFFSFMHSTFARPFITLAIGLYVVDRLILRYCLRQKRMVATTQFLKDDQVVQLSINKPVRQSKAMNAFKSSIASYLAAPWAPGCHVLMTVKSLDAPYNTESHPLYLMSAQDKTDQFFQRDDVQLVVKDYGDWSNNLIKNCQTEPCLTGVELEGPYGSDTSLELFRDCDVCILIASACGMAPIIPIVQSLVDWESGYNPVTNETSPRKQEILVVLVYREHQNLEWFEDHMKRLEGSGIEYIAIGPTEIYTNPAKELKNTVDWFMEMCDPNMKKRTGILCSGPRSLQRTVRGAASKARAGGYKCVVDTLSYSM